MSETTTRAAFVAEIAAAVAALPAAQAALATANSNLEASKQSWDTARTTYGGGSTQERTAFADYEEKLALQRTADAGVIAKQAVITERNKDLIALPSGRAWQDAEAKGSALVHGKQFMAEALGARFTNAATALQTLRGLITAAITPDQLNSQSATALATITSNLAVQKVGAIDLRQGTPTARPVTFVSPIQESQKLEGNP